jgi:hypothetical protein
MVCRVSAVLIGRPSGRGREISRPGGTARLLCRAIVAKGATAVGSPTDAPPPERLPAGMCFACRSAAATTETVRHRSCDSSWIFAPTRRRISSRRASTPSAAPA